MQSSTMESPTMESVQEASSQESARHVARRIFAIGEEPMEIARDYSEETFTHLPHRSEASRIPFFGYE